MKDYFLRDGDNPNNLSALRDYILKKKLKNIPSKSV